MFYVFDYDGTLSDPKNRLHFLKGDKPDWDSFFEACHTDEPINEMLNLLDLIVRYPCKVDDTIRIEIWTGRPERCREKSVWWLQEQGIDLTGITMRMRPDDYRGHDVALKQAWLAEAGKPDMIFEDRNSVVEMWRSEGIRCLQVAPGDF